MLAVLIAANAVEFRGKRRQDADALAALGEAETPTLCLARKPYLQTLNIEQVLHMLNFVLIAILIAVLTA